MPRKARIDAPGALHHIIVRGIERKAIFKDKFVERILKQTNEQLEEKYRLQGSVVSLEGLVKKVAHHFDIDPGNLKSASKERPVTEARRVLCYIAARKMGYKCTEVSKALDISAVTVIKAASLGSKLSAIGKIQKEILRN